MPTKSLYLCLSIPPSPPPVVCWLSQAEREKASAALAVEKAEVETLRAARAVLERDLSAALDSSREAVAAAQQTAEVELSKARAQQVRPGRGTGGSFATCLLQQSR
jgi:hypothetical protein